MNRLSRPRHEVSSTRLSSATVTVYLGFRIPAKVKDSALEIQFSGYFGVPHFTVQATPWNARGLLDDENRGFLKAGTGSRGRRLSKQRALLGEGPRPSDYIDATDTIPRQPSGSPTPDARFRRAERGVRMSLRNARQWRASSLPPMSVACATSKARASHVRRRASRVLGGAILAGTDRGLGVFRVTSAARVGDERTRGR